MFGIRTLVLTFVLGSVFGALLMLLVVKAMPNKFLDCESFVQKEVKRHLKDVEESILKMLGDDMWGRFGE
jgi:uncharacterized membrane protein YdjX (TVP38/TMEM64 family)